MIPSSFTVRVPRQECTPTNPCKHAANTHTPHLTLRLMLACLVRPQVLRSKLDKVDDTLSRMSETGDSAASDSVGLPRQLGYLSTSISLGLSPTATTPL